MIVRIVRVSALLLVAIWLGACGRPRTYAVLMPEPDGSVGRVELRSKLGTRELASPGMAAGFDVGKKASAIDDEEIRDRFGKALDAAPEEPARFVLLFRSDSSHLLDASRAILPKIVEATKNRPVAEILLIGRADRVGATRYNDRLALARAQTIRRELVRRGVASNRIEVVALGEEQPIVPTKDGVRERRNRRVDVTVR